METYDKHCPKCGAPQAPSASFPKRYACGSKKYNNGWHYTAACVEAVFQKYKRATALLAAWYGVVSPSPITIRETADYLEVEGYEFS